MHIFKCNGEKENLPLLKGRGKYNSNITTTFPMVILTISREVEHDKDGKLISKESKKNTTIRKKKSAKSSHNSLYPH